MSPICRRLYALPLRLVLDAVSVFRVSHGFKFGSGHRFSRTFDRITDIGRLPLSGVAQRFDIVGRVHNRLRFSRRCLLCLFRFFPWFEFCVLDACWLWGSGGFADVLRLRALAKLARFGRDFDLGLGYGGTGTIDRERSFRGMVSSETGDDGIQSRFGCELSSFRILSLAECLVRLLCALIRTLRSLCRKQRTQRFEFGSSQQ